MESTEEGRNLERGCRQIQKKCGEGHIQQRRPRKNGIVQISASQSK